VKGKKHGKVVNSGIGSPTSSSCPHDQESDDDVPPEVVDELGENRGNKIQENTKKRTRLHKGDEEKKPAAKKSNYGFS
jgi:hypothetical protein